MNTHIKTLRQTKGFTQKQIAEKLCVTQPSYARLESGLTSMTLDRAEKLSTALGVSVQHIMTAQEDPFPDLTLTNEYIKKLIDLNEALRKRLDLVIENQVTMLEKQNRELLEIIRLQQQSPIPQNHFTSKSDTE